MTLSKATKLALKIRKGCKRTPYIINKSKDCYYYLTINGLLNSVVKDESENCSFNLEDVFMSVVNGEV